MRHIRKNDLRARVKQEWLDTASEALEELRNLPVEDRSDYIRTFFQEHADLWTDLKACLAGPEPTKCWYSEVQRPISELEIDHFRPKNAVSGTMPKHRGYWWLAFEWENFRISSELANKRRKDSLTGKVFGKGAHFPLVDPNQRVSDNAPASTRHERPLLLDPFVASDVRLLDYRTDGKVVEKSSLAQNQTEHLRAKKSIEFYHLNEGSLIADRGGLATIIQAASERIDSLWSRKESGQQLTPQEENDLSVAEDQIANMINATSEFSAFCRACLKQQGNRGWNEELLAIC